MSDRVMVETQITGWLLATLNVEIPSPESDLLETGVLDSAGFVELLLYLEQAFDIRITLEQLEVDTFRSVARIAAFLLNGGQAAEHAEKRVGRP